MLVVLDGFAGVDDSSVAGLELGIVVEGFADGLALFDGGLNAFEGFGEAGFERGLAPGSFGNQRGELFVTGGFEPDADLAEFGREPVFGDPILFETGEFGLRGEDVIVFSARSFVDRGFHEFEVGDGGLDLLFLLCDEFAELFVGDKSIRVVGVEIGLKLVMFDDKVAVGLVLQSEAGFEVHVLNFVAFRGVTPDRVAVSLGHCEFLASLGPVFPLAGGLPDADVVDRGAGQVELECEVLASAINDRVFAEDKFVVAQVRDYFVVPVFDRHGLPLVGSRSADAFAKLGGDDAGVAIDGCVDLEVIGVNLGDAVVATTAAGHEAKVCRLTGEFEVELDDRVVEGGVFEEDSFGFGRIDISTQQRTVTQGEIGLETPAFRDGHGVEVVREEEFAGSAHQGVSWSGHLGGC